MTTTVQGYFLGEKLQCSIGIAISALSIAAALYFLVQVKTDLYKGMAWPFIIISVLLLVICTGVVWRTSGDIERVNRFVQQDPEKIATEEVPRMEKVMHNFKVIKVIELCLLGAGLCLVLVSTYSGNMLWKGIGLGLAIQSAIMFGFDYFAHSRGKMYYEFLQGL